MEATDNFKATIKKYLDVKASSDELFAKVYSNEKKSLSECIKFILTEVRKSGKCAMSDDEVYGIAIHYYDEANVKVDDDVSVRVVFPNTGIEISEEEKEEAKRKAIEAYQQELKEKMLNDAMVKKSKKKSKTINQPTLF